MSPPEAILIDRDSYFVEFSIYVVLTPVRAGMVDSLAEWCWSNNRDMSGDRTPPEWLATDARPAQFSSKRADAVQGYVQFVAEGIGAAPIWNNLKRQIYLGEDRFVERIQATREGLSKSIEVPKAQK